LVFGKTVVGNAEWVFGIFWYEFLSRDEGGLFTSNRVEADEVVEALDGFAGFQLGSGGGIEPARGTLEAGFKIAGVKNTVNGEFGWVCLTKGWLIGQQYP
jgi:hypothetical protein